MTALTRQSSVFPIQEGNFRAPARRVSAADFDVLRVLGQGGFGRVYLVRKRNGPDAGKLYAMKVLKKAEIRVPKQAAEFQAERDILEAIRKIPFVVKLHYAFQDRSRLHLILQFAQGGDLFTRLSTEQQLPESHARFYAAEIIVALEMLHKIGVLYRDMKLENVLLDSSGHVLLTDFGLSKEYIDTDSDRAHTYAGTVDYMAPELIAARMHDQSDTAEDLAGFESRNMSIEEDDDGNGASAQEPADASDDDDSGYTRLVDWWAVAVLLDELVRGTATFTSWDPDEDYDKDVIRHRILHSDPSFPFWYSAELRDLLEKMLTKEPSRRLGYRGVDEIKRHPFFASIDWEKLARKEVAPPYVPPLKGEDDVQHFDAEFTSAEPVMTPLEPTENPFAVFRSFSYVAPEVLFSPGALTADKSPPDFTQAPTVEASPFRVKYHVVRHVHSSDSVSALRVCQNRATKKYYAVKIISNRVAGTLTEADVIKMLHPHRHIPQLVELLTDDLHTYIVMELFTGGELFERVRQYENFTETKARHLFRQIACVIHHMHKNGIVHRDLKPSCLHFASRDEDAPLLLVDFSHARRLMSNAEHPTSPGTTSASSTKSPGNASLSRSTTFPVTQGPHNHAPLDHFVEDSMDCPNTIFTQVNRSDLWSAGVLLYFLLYGCSPFEIRQDISHAAFLCTLDDKSFSFPDEDDPDFYNSVSDQAKDLIRHLLAADGSIQSADTLLAHPWLSSSSIIEEAPLASPSLLGPQPQMSPLFAFGLQLDNIPSTPRSASSAHPLSRAMSLDYPSSGASGSDVAPQNGHEQAHPLAFSVSADSSHGSGEGQREPTKRGASGMSRQSSHPERSINFVNNTIRQMNLGNVEESALVKRRKTKKSSTGIPVTP